MSEQTKTPQRRLLARRRRPMEANNSARHWRQMLGPDADVRVEYGAAGTTDEFPWGITANKGSGS